MDDTKLSSWFLSATHAKDLFGVQKFSETIPSKSETKSKFEPYITGCHKERVPTWAFELVLTLSLSIWLYWCLKNGE